MCILATSEFSHEAVKAGGCTIHHSRSEKRSIDWFSQLINRSFENFKTACKVWLIDSISVRIHDILVWIRIRGSILTNGSGSGSCYFIHWPLKKTNFSREFPLGFFYFLKVQLHHFSKIKSQKEVTKQKESRLFLLFTILTISIIVNWLRAESILVGT